MRLAELDGLLYRLENHNASCGPNTIPNLQLVHACHTAGVPPRIRSAGALHQWVLDLQMEYVRLPHYANGAVEPGDAALTGGNRG